MIFKHQAVSSNKRLNRTQTRWLRFAIIANKFVPFSLSRYITSKTICGVYG
jgi:hypothetical protein